MQRDYIKWYSPSLGRDMELLAYGHAGFPVVAAAAVWRQSRKAGTVLWVWAVIVWVVVVYLGEHYVADVIGGIVYAVIAMTIARSLAARFLRRAAPPTPRSPA